MDSNNLSEISIQDDLDESDFSALSLAGMDSKQMADKIQKLEAELAKTKESESYSDQFDGGLPSLGQMFWQFGEKFGKMENQMEVMKKEFTKKIAALEGKIVDNKRQIKEIKEENGKLKKEFEEKCRAMEKMETEIRGFKTAKEEGKAEFDEIKVQCEKLSQKLGELQEKQMAENESLANLAEQIDELGACIEMDLIDMKVNKLNPADSGSKMLISDERHVVKHSGPAGWNCICAQMAIPKLNLNPKSVAYFEVEILQNPRNLDGIRIGFFTLQFPLECNLLGIEKNSIGIKNKKGMEIDGCENNFQNAGGYFQARDVIGVGIVHFSANLAMKCFATCNGKLLGKVKLPSKFATLQLFPTITLFCGTDSIRANFGTNPWRYNPRQFIK